MKITDPRAVYMLSVFEDIYPHRTWSYEFWSWGIGGWSKSTDDLLTKNQHVIEYSTHPRRMTDPRTFWFDGSRLASNKTEWIVCDLTDHALVVDIARKIFNAEIV
jgi:hypothetical protein